ncbi:MAG: hypothetical protein R2771_00140 [Saprospiraceae bacterium]
MSDLLLDKIQSRVSRYSIRFENADLAIDSYQEYLESNPDDEAAMYRLAKSCI